MRILVIVAAWVCVEGCARTLRHPVEQPTPALTAQLWREPLDLAAQDLFHGGGGPELAPQGTTYTFVAHKTSGTNPGYDVRDSRGRLWSVKLGEEAQSEVTTSRILWALGFHQPPTYYVERWQLTGEQSGEQPAGRFRIDPRGDEVVGEWSWYDNPFIASRPFGALVAVNLLLHNWDLKTSNNKIYAVTNEDGVSEYRYVVRDLGASLGKARQPRVLSWLPFMRHMQGSKNELDAFEERGWVRAVEGETIDFDYRGLDEALADRVTVAELRWTCDLLSRLSEKQWLDAFRAGGYTPDQQTRYVRKIRENITHARRLVSG